MSIKILHFADAHIDSFTGGKQDGKTGLPVHTVDFLKSLDQIVDTAVEENVRLVLFAGDAYRNPHPAPTFQREWGQRMKRLSDARIPVLMIAGNHDVNPALFKASSLQEIDTFDVPYLHLAKSIHLWTPEELDGAPVQVLAIPWLSKNMLDAHLAGENAGKKVLTQKDLTRQMEEEIMARVERALKKVNPALPVILLAHYDVVGALYPSGTQVSAGGETVTLPFSLVRDEVFSYCALGHIHRYQDLNKGEQPPAVYCGSIEHVDYGEAGEPKGFVLAEVDTRHTEYEFRRLHTRPMYNRSLEAKASETLQQELLDLLPAPEQASGAMVRISVTYPAEWEAAIDEKELRSRMAEALDFRLIRHPQHNKSIRLMDKNISSLTPSDLLQIYCKRQQFAEADSGALAELAMELFAEAENKDIKD